MIAVWYDPDCDQIWITNEERSYARRSLVASIDPDSGKVTIRLKDGLSEPIVTTPFGNLSRKDGSGFGSASDAVVYLSGEFAKRRLGGDAFAIGVAIAARGQATIPLQDPPTLLSSVRLEVNGCTYRAPEIGASAVAVTWLNSDFPLDPSDRVTVVYS